MREANRDIIKYINMLCYVSETPSFKDANSPNSFIGSMQFKSNSKQNIFVEINKLT